MSKLLGQLYGVEFKSEEDLEKEYNDYKAAQAAQMKNLYEMIHQQAAEQAQEEVPENTNHNLAFVGFGVDPNGDVSITCQWNGKEEHVADALASLMFHMNTGKFEDKLIQVLEGQAVQVPEHREFVKRAFKAYGHLVGQEKSVMEPSDVLSNPKD